MQVGSSVVGPKRLHGDIDFVDTQAVGDTWRNIFEDLLLREGVGEHEGVVERVQETDLDKGRVGRLIWSAAWRCDDMWKA